jgi:hypothetical protein
MNNKQDVIESLTGGLKSTSAWRTVTFTRFPDDFRNEKASKTLDRLAAEASNLTDAQFLELSPHFDWGSGAWRNALNLTARSVGFHHRAANLDMFVKILIQNLPPVTVAA